MRIYPFLSWALVLLWINGAHGYELATHGRLTEQAFTRSNLAQDPQLLLDLGLDATSNNPFGDKYYDVSDDDIRLRTVDDFEKTARRMRNPDEALTVKGWLMRGAIREDDYPVGPNPKDDPVNEFRFRNHFFDPAFNQPLTLPFWGKIGDIAPNWALGTQDVFSAPNQENWARKNHFTVFDAREAMYRALTGRRSDGVVLETSNTLPKDKDVRNAYWATTFRALGDVVHLIEDMAQPQHTRNDVHGGSKFDEKSWLLGHKSLYESWIEARATGRDAQPMRRG